MGLRKSGNELSYTAKVDISQAMKAVDELKKRFDNLGLQNATEAQRNFNKAQLEFQDQVRKARLELAKLKQEEQEMRNTRAKSAADIAEINRQISQNRLEQQQLRIALQRARTEQTAASGSYREAQLRLRQLGDQIRKVEGGFDGLGRVQRARIEEYKRLNAQILEFDRRMGNHQKNVGNYPKVMESARGKLLGLASAYVSAGLALSAAFTTSMKTDSLKTSLTFILGSSDLASEKLERLRETANRLGLEYVSLADTYKSFAGAATASNYPLEKAEKVFNAVTNAGAKLKLSSDQMSGALLAIQQMISKGNVQAEELRGQLGERLPGAFAIAARAMGVTEKELNKMLQKGEVLAVDLLPKLANELDKTFGNDQNQRVDSLQASVNRLYNTFSLAIEKGAVGSFFKLIVDGANNALTGIEQVTRGLNKSMYDSAIKNYEKSLKLFPKDADLPALTTRTGNYFISTEDVQAEIKLRNREKQQQKLNELNQIGLRVGKDIIINNKQTGETLASLNREEAKLVELRRQREELDSKGAKKDKTELARINSAIVKQKAVVQTLSEAYAKPLVELSPSEKKAQEAKLNSINEFSKKVTDIHNASFRKTLTTDDAEIQAVKDKYAKITQETDQFYKKNGNVVVKINGKNVSKSEVYGTLKADQKNEEQAILDKRQAETDEKERKAAKEHYDDLLKEFRDFSQNMEQLKFDYEKDAKILENDPRQKAERKKKYDEDVNALIEANSKKLSEYEKLFEGIEQLSRKEALLVIDKARAMLQSDKNAGLVSEKVAKETEELFDKVTKSVVSGTKEAGEELISLANQIDQVAASVSGIDEVFAKVLSTVANVVGQVGNINKGMSEFKTASGKGANGMKDFSQLGQLTAGLGIFGAGVSIFSSVIKMFDRSAQREEQAAYSRDLQNKQTEALNKALERQVALLDEVYGTERITNYSLAIKQATQNQEKYTAELSGRLQRSGNNDIDKYLEELNNTGSVKQYEMFGTKFLENFKKQFAKLPTDLAQLQQLLDEGKLDASTANIVTNLLKAVEVAQQLQNKLNAELTGTSIAQLADDFISTLTDGTQDFGKRFEETIQKSILNGFKGQLIEKQLQAFYTQFAQLSEGGLTSSEIETLRKSYLQASEKAKKDLEALSNATGIDLTGNSKSNQGTVARGITPILETSLILRAVNYSKINNIRCQ